MLKAITAQPVVCDETNPITEFISDHRLLVDAVESLEAPSSLQNKNKKVGNYLNR